MESSVLTHEMVLAKCKSTNLESIKNINLWGNRLEDLSLLQKMPNLEVISLSVNNISSLKWFAPCQKLSELYLRKNNIWDLSQVKLLAPLFNLRVLWLWDNPCCEIEDVYRVYIINVLPGLVKLDNTNISMEERKQAAKLDMQSLEQAVQNFVKENFPNNSLQDDERPHPEPKKVILSSSSSIVEDEKIREAPRRHWANNKEGDDSPSRKKDKETKSKEETNMSSSSGKPVKNENILLAVLALIHELDENGLELIKRDIEKKLVRFGSEY